MDNQEQQAALLERYFAALSGDADTAPPPALDPQRAAAASLLVQEMPGATPSPAFRKQLRTLLLAEAGRSKPPATPSPQLERLNTMQILRPSQPTSLPARLAAAALVLLVISGGLFFAYDLNNRNQPSVVGQPSATATSQAISPSHTPQATPSPTASLPVTPLTAREVLTRANAAFDAPSLTSVAISYSVRLPVPPGGPPQPPDLQAQFWYVAPNYWRYESSSDQPAGGYSEVNDGSRPRTEFISVFSRVNFAASIAGDGDCWLTPQFQASETVAGRPTWVIEIANNKQLCPAAATSLTHVWVDQQSYIALKVERFNSDGTLQQVRAVSAIQYNLAINPALFSPVTLPLPNGTPQDDEEPSPTHTVIPVPSSTPLPVPTGAAANQPTPEPNQNIYNASIAYKAANLRTLVLTQTYSPLETNPGTSISQRLWYAAPNQWRIEVVTSTNGVQSGSSTTISDGSDLAAALDLRLLNLNFFAYGTNWRADCYSTPRWRGYDQVLGRSALVFEATIDLSRCGPSRGRLAAKVSFYVDKESNLPLKRIDRNRDESIVRQWLVESLEYNQPLDASRFVQPGSTPVSQNTVTLPPADAEQLVARAVAATNSDGLANFEVNTFRTDDYAPLAYRHGHLSYQAASRWRSEGGGGGIDGNQLSYLEIADGTDLWSTEVYSPAKNVQVRRLEQQRNSLGYLLGWVGDSHLASSECYTTSLQGSAVVAGRSSYVISRTPRERLGKCWLGGMSGDEQGPVPTLRERYWIDSETYFPLKIELVTSNSGSDLVSTWQVTRIRYNASFDPAIFNYSLPPRASFTDLRFERMPSGSDRYRLAAADADRAPLTSFLPGYLPDNMRLYQVQYSPNQVQLLGTSAEQLTFTYYPDGSKAEDARYLSSLVVSQQPAVGRLARLYLSEGQEVSIGGVPTLLVGGGNTLSLILDGTLIVINYGTVTSEEAIKLAASLTRLAVGQPASQRPPTVVMPTPQPTETP